MASEGKRSSDISSHVEYVVKQLQSANPTGSSVPKLGFLFLSCAFAMFVSRLDPEPPRICGTLHGPSVTAPRIRLPDGRPLAYHESGVPKTHAKYKVVFVHNYGNSRLDLPFTQGSLEEHGVYMVSYDRAGYGESHPFPHRSIASEADDIQRLADSLELGSRFHVIAVGLGAYAAWGCLKYIPHRLAGVAIIEPVANFWWLNIPLALNNLKPADRYTLLVSHYSPWMLHLWMTQTWLPSSNLESFNKITEVGIQQGLQESIYKDLKIQFGNWGFDISEIKKPSLCEVYMWQKSENHYFPSGLQRMIKDKLPWIKYHDETQDIGEAVLHQLFMT